MRDPSPAHRLRALAAGTGGGTPLFYLLGWLWYRLVPAGELVWRPLPALPLVGAWRTWWRILRPRFGFLPAALALATQWWGNEAISRHFVEFRFCALVVLAQALPLLALLAAADPRSGRTRW